MQSDVEGGRVVWWWGRAFYVVCTDFLYYKHARKQKVWNSGGIKMCVCTPIPLCVCVCAFYVVCTNLCTYRYYLMYFDNHEPSACLPFTLLPALPWYNFFEFLQGKDIRHGQSLRPGRTVLIRC